MIKLFCLDRDREQGCETSVSNNEGIGPMNIKVRKPSL